MDLGSLEDDHTIQTISVRHKMFHILCTNAISQLVKCIPLIGWRHQISQVPLGGERLSFGKKPQQCRRLWMAYFNPLARELFMKQNSLSDQFRRSLIAKAIPQDSLSTSHTHVAHCPSLSTPSSLAALSSC